jgi:hypothetical protein
MAVDDAVSSDSSALAQTMRFQCPRGIAADKFKPLDLIDAALRKAMLSNLAIWAALAATITLPHLRSGTPCGAQEIG